MAGEYVSSLRVAVVCSSNMNRSMEAHAFLHKKGYHVMSFGTGEKIKLPGPTASQPNVYEFGTTYEEIYQDLKNKDNRLYTENGMLHMLDRNKRIKGQPDRLQDSSHKFDVIITADERVYDQVLEYWGERDSNGDTLVHLINIDIKDNHEEATIGAFMFLELVQMFAESSDLDNEIDELLQEFEQKCSRSILHSVLFY